MGAIEMIMITVVVIGFFVIVSVLASLYQKCGPNEPWLYPVAAKSRPSLSVEALWCFR